MKFICDNCRTQYLISDEKVGPKGVKIRCKHCGNVIILKQETAKPRVDEKAPEPPPSADDLFAEKKTPESEEDELGQAFDQLLKGAEGGEAGEGDEEEQQATEIFNPEEMAQLRLQEGWEDGEQKKIDEVFAKAESTSLNQATGERPEDKREEWYLAIQEEQVGPVGLRIVEEKFVAGQINGQTLVWHPGMEEWLPLQDVPQLRYMLGAEKNEGEIPAGIAPDNEKMAAAPQWNVSEGSSLSALVQDELQAVKNAGVPEKKVTKEKTDSGLDDEEELAPWEKDDVVSGEVAKPAESFFDSSSDRSSSASGLSDDLGVGYHPGRVVTSKPAYLSGVSGGKLKAKWWLIGSVCLVVVLGGGIATTLVLSNKSTAQETDENSPKRPVDPNAIGNSTDQKPNPPKDSSSVGQETPKTNPDTQTKPDEGKEVAENKNKDNKETMVVKNAGSTEKPLADDLKSTKGKKKKKDKVKPGKKQIAQKTETETTEKPQETPSVQESGSLPETLSKADIGANMKKYLGALKGCVQQQNQRDPNVAGTMMVSFVIQGNGRVSDISIDSSEHKGTYVAGCFKEILQSMKFQKFTGSPIPMKQIKFKLDKS